MISIKTIKVFICLIFAYALIGNKVEYLNKSDNCNEICFEQIDTDTTKQKLDTALLEVNLMIEQAKREVEKLKREYNKKRNY